MGIAEGIKQMDKDGNGVIDSNEFCKWMSEEREKEGHQGLKMNMLKAKMRAQKFKSDVEVGLKKARPSSTLLGNQLPPRPAVQSWMVWAAPLTGKRASVQQSQCVMGLRVATKSCRPFTIRSLTWPLRVARSWRRRAQRCSSMASLHCV